MIETIREYRRLHYAAHRTVSGGQDIASIARLLDQLTSKMHTEIIQWIRGIPVRRDADIAAVAFDEFEHMIRRQVEVESALAVLATVPHHDTLNEALVMRRTHLMFELDDVVAAQHDALRVLEDPILHATPSP